jgi:NAD(P)H-hydrate epimerase
MVHGMETPARELLAPLLDRCDVVAVGPGLGQAAWGRDAFDAVLEASRALVIDADGLNLLPDMSGRAVLPSDCILTPHPGEAARLLGRSTSAVQSDRMGAAFALAKRHGCVVVLKGAGTIVAAPDRLPCIIDAGNPGMAVGGMGDVLCGVIAALRGQRLAAFDAACLGALLHSVAADEAAKAGGARGLLPTDLMPWLRRLGNPSPDPQDTRNA